jgi:hypothetical protein
MFPGPSQRFGHRQPSFVADCCVVVKEKNRGTRRRRQDSSGARPRAVGVEDAQRIRQFFLDKRAVGSDNLKKVPNLVLMPG